MFIKTERITIRKQTAPTLRYNDFMLLSLLLAFENFNGEEEGEATVSAWPDQEKGRGINSSPKFYSLKGLL